jgi:vanillate O-demethylase monooxygenase subunit
MMNAGTVSNPAPARTRGVSAQDMPYFRDCWYVADWSDSVAADTMVGRTIAEEPVLLYRKGDGAIVAMADRCCHRLAPLSLGAIEDGHIRCGYHGAKFATTGACVEFPGIAKVPASFCIKTYPVVERHRWIWVWVGDPQKADPALIPDAGMNDSPDMVVRQGEMTHEVNHILVSDNLLDFSHLAYVHPKSFGAGADWADTRATVTELPRGVRVERWLLDQPPWPFLPQTMRIDIFNTYDYLWPGVLILAGRNYPAGTADRFDGKLPPQEHLLSMGAACQAVTPVDARTTRYLFASITPRADATEEVVQRRHAVTTAAFEEDKVMLHAQQRIIDLSPGEKMMPMAHDRATVLFRRQLAEQSAA